MSRFKTLLLREWMQHHRGWLAVMLVPPVLILVALMLTGSPAITPHGPTDLMIACTAVVTLIVFAVTWMVVVLLLPGVARRDQQDRSIEFWLSLPTPHTMSVGATVLMHALLVPLLALRIGYLCSLVIGFLAVLMTSGAPGLLEVPWSETLTGGVAFFLRLVFGVVLGSLWVTPILLLAMAASAWLKRWGVPVLIAALVAGHVVLAKFYGISWIGDTLYEMWSNALLSMIHGVPDAMKGHGEFVMAAQWPVTPAWLAQDALAAVTELAQPLFVFGLVLGAGCFALLVLRRRRA